MNNSLGRSIGFIGGGRITRIILSAINRKAVDFNSIVVSEINDTVTEELRKNFKNITIEKGSYKAAGQDYIFISLHPPAITGALDKISHLINEKSIIISLAPKITIKKLSELLKGFNRIVRMIPNAPSVINLGYNPVTFSPSLDEHTKSSLKEFFKILGEAPEVKENKLEAYAVLTAMGPTYFWFQLYELIKLSKEFGLDNDETETAVRKMLSGSVETMFSGMDRGSVLDLIPVKPLSEFENSITCGYEKALKEIYSKIKVTEPQA